MIFIYLIFALINPKSRPLAPLAAQPTKAVWGFKQYSNTGSGYRYCYTALHDTVSYSLAGFFVIMVTKTLPRVGCGAVLLKQGCLLLVHRKRDPERNHWGLPGGKVDPFETVPHAVIREIWEETGIHITELSLLCVVDQIDTEQNTHWVAPVYIAQNFEGDAIAKEPEALAGIGWFPLQQLPDCLTIATQTALTALRQQGLIQAL